MQKKDLSEFNYTYPVLEEETYLAQMKELVDPYLDSLREKIYLPREETQTYYCEYYLLPEKERRRGSILISHGFTESCNKYHEMIYYFLQAGYCVLAVDHRGHGRSRKMVEENVAEAPTHVEHFQQYVEDLDEVVRQVLLTRLPGPYYLYAHSMGGCIGVTYLEKRPGVFTKAVLTAPMMEINRGGIPKKVAEMTASLACALGKGKKFMTGQGNFSSQLDFEHSASTCEPRYRYYFEQQLQHPEFQNGGCSYGWAKEAFAACNLALEEEPCKKIWIPVLLFQAGQDGFVLPGGQDQLISQIPHGQIISVPEAKHEIYLTDSETLGKYVGLILKFLA